MAANALVDTSFLVAFVNRRDANHRWALAQAPKLSLPWKTCEAVLAEAFYVMGPSGGQPLRDLLKRRALVCAFQLNEHLEEILKLLERYADIPISLADACLVRMTETLADPVLYTVDSDFRIYRRNSRLTIPCVFPR